MMGFQKAGSGFSPGGMGLLLPQARRFPLEQAWKGVLSGGLSGKPPPLVYPAAAMYEVGIT